MNRGHRHGANQRRYNAAANRVLAQGRIDPAFFLDLQLSLQRVLQDVGQFDGLSQVEVAADGTAAIGNDRLNHRRGVKFVIQDDRQAVRPAALRLVLGRNLLEQLSALIVQEEMDFGFVGHRMPTHAGPFHILAGQGPVRGSS